jgi:hypothetical protein
VVHLVQEDVRQDQVKHFNKPRCHKARKNFAVKNRLRQSTVMTIKFVCYCVLHG